MRAESGETHMPVWTHPPLAGLWTVWRGPFLLQMSILLLGRFRSFLLVCRVGPVPALAPSLYTPRVPLLFPGDSQSELFYPEVQCAPGSSSSLPPSSKNLEGVVVPLGEDQRDRGALWGCGTTTLKWTGKAAPAEQGQLQHLPHSWSVFLLLHLV